MLRARARVRVVGRFDGARLATVIVWQKGDEPFVTVRPYRRRRAYTLPLAAVASGVIFDVTRAELAEKARAKAARPGASRRRR